MGVGNVTYLARGKNFLAISTSSVWRARFVKFEWTEVKDSRRLVSRHVGTYTTWSIISTFFVNNHPKAPSSRILFDSVHRS